MWNLFVKRDKVEKVRAMLRRIIDRQAKRGIIALDQRLESRSNQCLVVMVVPVSDDSPMVEEAFPSLTRDLSSTGLSLIVNQPLRHQELIVGIQEESSLTFVRARPAHTEPLGGGFLQVGLQITELVHPDDYPELSTLTL